MVDEVEAMGGDVEETARKKRNGSSSMLNREAELIHREVGETAVREQLCRILPRRRIFKGMGKVLETKVGRGRGERCPLRDADP